MATGFLKFAAYQCPRKNKNAGRCNYGR